MKKHASKSAKKAAPKSRSSSRKTKNRAAKTTSDSSSEPRPPIGLESTYELVVPHDWTIQTIDSRLPAVLSTPRMIQMMEHAAAVAVQPALPPGSISVGTRIEVDHLKAVSDGAVVRAHARLARYKGRFLVFDVEAKAGDIVIGRGKVFRAIVHSGSHGEKARARVSSSNPES
jgi:fluoroacetyl-CoA thioesterase